MTCYFVLSDVLDVTPISVSHNFNPGEGYGVSNYTKGGQNATIEFNITMAAWTDSDQNVTEITFELPTNVIFSDLENASNGTILNDSTDNNWWCQSSTAGLDYYLNWSCYNATESQLGPNDLISVWFNFTANNTGTEEPIAWTIIIVGNGSQQNANTTYYSTNVDAQAPRIALSSPANDNNDTTGNVQFAYTPVDNNLDTCELWGNWSGGWHLNDTFISPTNNVSNSSNTLGIESGRYVWTIYCNDTLANNNITNDNYTLKVDTVQPALEVISDIAVNEDFTEFSIDLTANLSDNLDTDSELSVSFNVNNSNVSLSMNNATSNLTITAVANETETANITLITVDSSGNTNLTSFDLIITAQNDAPWWDPIDDIAVNENFNTFD
ncbi:hypothetical protein FJZ53_04960, partial [Candidatus Woesearchaeota archaeon]|nr:hypothetical protein [Candidatus Woesearchaeota archaeon]